jgi:hypothetical protein
MQPSTSSLPSRTPPHRLTRTPLPVAGGRGPVPLAVCVDAVGDGAQAKRQRERRRRAGAVQTVRAALWRSGTSAKWRVTAALLPLPMLPMLWSDGRGL